jgi:hypothetical protein
VGAYFLLGAVQDASASSPVRRDSIVVERPEPGIARGVWEAPSWAFLAAGALAVGVFAVFFGRRWRHKR